MILLRIRPLDGGFVEIYPSGFDPAVRDQMRLVPGSIWSREKRCYTAPEEALESVLQTLEKARVARVRREQAPATREPGRTLWRPLGPSRKGLELMKHQLEGIAFLREKLTAFSAAILADEMGLMKTAQAILACKPGKLTVVVCPAVVATHWQDEIRDWAGEEALVWTGKKKPKLVADALAASPFRWLVMSYDMFRKLWPSLPIAHQIIIDELHYLGSSKALRSKAVREYLQRCQSGCDAASSHRKPSLIGLTGTPITAWLENLHNPLDLLFPGRFGTWWQFTARYCNGRFEPLEDKLGRPILDYEGLPRRVWRADGVSNLAELRSRLAHFLLRRTKKDSGIELPPRIRTTIPVDLPAGARKELRQLTREVRSPDALKRALRGVEVYKLDAAVELAEELRDAGNRVLLFTNRRAHARTLGERLKAPVVTGEDDPSERRDRLIENDAKVAVATMYSVTTGIDLTHFDSCIFVGLDWVPSNLLQAEARLHRPGQKKTVNVYFLIGRPSIDEHIRKVVVDRLETFSEVLGDGTASEKELAQELENRSDLIGDIVRMVQEST